MDNLELRFFSILLPVTCIVGCLEEVTYFDTGVAIENILLLVDEVDEKLLVLVEEECFVGSLSLEHGNHHVTYGNFASTHNELFNLALISHSREGNVAELLNLLGSEFLCTENGIDSLNGEFLDVFLAEFFETCLT